MRKKIRVLIVDDSAVIRQSLTKILEHSEQIEIIATASDPYVAAACMKKEIPDVITLDLDMPRMDGLTFLHRLMTQYPVPVVVISSLTRKGSPEVIKALEYGAVDVIHKPNLINQKNIDESSIQIIDAVIAASMSRPARRNISTRPEPSILRATALPAFDFNNKTIIAIGASTGGTEAIQTILAGLPANTPPVIIVQHMPAGFTRTFAERLDSLFPFRVKEAENDEELTVGKVLIAPGGYHLAVKRSPAGLYTHAYSGPLVNRHRPAVDVLFSSVARAAGSNATGILLTGMGADGAAGLLEMKQAGALTIAQDKATSAVYGMPKEAEKIGAAQFVLPINQIAEFVINKIKNAR
ncbi:MAG TPA: chemotaxis response regulator protein-glutamate methylesterase [Bacteroidales bacterium]|nr:chemotaxis response regulator protein-glutamate methylesterase [Bacteroidales bacterium]